MVDQRCADVRSCLANRTSVEHLRGEIERLRAIIRADGEQHAAHVKVIEHSQDVRLDAYKAEIERLRERLGPRGLEVIEINGAGHYVNIKVRDEIERLRSEIACGRTAG